MFAVGVKGRISCASFIFSCRLWFGFLILPLSVATAYQYVCGPSCSTPRCSQITSASHPAGTATTSQVVFIWYYKILLKSKFSSLLPTLNPNRLKFACHKIAVINEINSTDRARRPVFVLLGNKSIFWKNTRLYVVKNWNSNKFETHSRSSLFTISSYTKYLIYYKIAFSLVLVFLLLYHPSIGKPCFCVKYFSYLYPN